MYIVKNNVQALFLNLLMFLRICLTLPITILRLVKEVFEIKINKELSVLQTQNRLIQIVIRSYFLVQSFKYVCLWNTYLA